MPLDGSKLRAIEFGLTALGERLEGLERARTHRSDEFAEHKHPRGPDGKFTSGSGGSAVKQAAHKYIQGLLSKGNKPKQQGFTKHLLEQGFPAKAVAAAVEEEFGEEKPHAYVKGIHGKFKKLISDFPALNHEEWAEKYHGEPEAAGVSPSPSAPAAEQPPAAEPAQAPAASPAQAKGQLSPATKSIYQKNIDGWQHSISAGDDELQNKFSEVMDAQFESDPVKKQEMIAALKPLGLLSGSDHADSMNEFIAGIKEDAGFGAGEGNSAPAEQPAPSSPSKEVPPIPESLNKGQVKLAYDFVSGDKPFPEHYKDKYQSIFSYLEQAQDNYNPGEPQHEYLQKLIDHESSKGTATDPERVLPPKPASGAMPEPPAGLGTGDIIKKVALGQFPSSGQSPAEQLQGLIDSSSSSQEEKAYAQKLLDHLNGETSAPGPASSAATAPSANPHANGLQPPSYDTSNIKNSTQKDLGGYAYKYLSGKLKPHTGSSISMLQDQLNKAKDPKVKEYVKGLIDAVESGSVKLPHYEIDSVPETSAKITKAFCQKAFNCAQLPHISQTEKIDGLISLRGKATDSADDYINGLIKTIKINKANAEYVPPNAGPVAPGHKLSAETHKELAENAKHWDKVGPSLKPAVDEKHNELKAALAHPTAAAQKNAIAALKPIENPSGMGQKSMNSFIAKVQNEYGVAPQPVTTAPTASPTPAQQAKAQTNVAAALKKAPHKVIKHINELEDHTGAMVQAKHVAETSKILGDHYHKVTAAYGNSQDAMAPAVDKAMTAYWKDIDKTWDAPTKDAIYAYQNGHSGSINKYFREGPNAVDESTKTKVAKMQKALESSFVPADTPAWRGLNCKFEELTGFADPSDSVGRCFEHKNFASISRRKQTSLNFGSNVLMKMTIPAGTPGLVVGGQTDGDGGKHSEKEIILGPYSMWRIDKYEKGAQGANHLIHVTYLGERTDGKHDMTTKDN